MAVRDEWSAGETEVLAGAMVRTPTARGTQPWRLELSAGRALLFERSDPAWPGDLRERDRAIACGAALANLEVAVRVLARNPGVSLLPDPSRPDLLARLTADRGRLPSHTDLQRYSALARGRGDRGPATRSEATDHDIKDLVAASSADGVPVRVVREAAECGALAAVLDGAAPVHDDAAPVHDDAAPVHDDAQPVADGAAPVPGVTGARSGGAVSGSPGALWTTWAGRAHRHGGRAPRAAPALPWAGLVRPGRARPGEGAHRLGDGTVLVFSGAGDDKLDHVRTGLAMQHTWLAAVDRGLSVAVLTQPLHPPAVCRGVRDLLGLAGPPLLLMLLGRPDLAAAPGRRPAARPPHDAP